ncbi:transmembrane protease serine 9-like [Gigantopelta aegis]|uniref:transmembrane protease serine 9-like n=1 Tax=Gigantopelta aegis TaxID=1735272 RepID=UPI001B889962|nr:transmembrane protease serine 9-like [Gigantopelta aegis]
MASLTGSLGVLFAFLCCASALSVPSFCNACQIDVRNRYCMYCCAMYSCCGTGTPKEECDIIQCGCNPAGTEDPTESPTTTPEPTTTPKPRDCAMPLVSSRILGGSDVDVCDRPWMVHFTADMSGSIPTMPGEPAPEGLDKIPSCSGVLVDATTILTTKTCYDQFITIIDIPKVEVYAQFADSVRDLATRRGVRKEDIEVKGDIVFINITRVPVDKDFCIYPVCLPDNTTVFSEEETRNCRVASWGFQESNSTSSPEKLHEAEISLMSSNCCSGLIPILDQLDITIPAPENMGFICSNPKTATTSTCEFDQGGMLMCQDQMNNWLLAGIAYGTPCDPKKPSTFVDITKNLEIINSKITPQRRMRDVPRDVAEFKKGTFSIQSWNAMCIKVFKSRCETNVWDPYCQYCCAVYKCCGTDVPMQECSSFKCGCTQQQPPPPSPTPKPTMTTTPKSRECKLPKTTTRILGGHSVDVCDRPWMVHFVDRNVPFPLCSGVLISEKHILTSNKCAVYLTVPATSSDVVARFADSENFKQLDRQVVRNNVIVKGDIAVVTLNTRVPLDKDDFCIQSVCLPDETAVFADNSKQKCKMASWGMTTSDPQSYLTPKALQEAEVTLMPSDVCRHLIPILNHYITPQIDVPSDGVICTDPKDALISTCEMDQGGMLLCQDQADASGSNWVLAGVTFGTPCDPNAPSTFIDVRKNLDAIKTFLP